jgi:hypothetical protein
MDKSWVKRLIISITLIGSTCINFFEQSKHNIETFKSYFFLPANVEIALSITIIARVRGSASSMKASARSLHSTESPLNVSENFKHRTAFRAQFVTLHPCRSCDKNVDAADAISPETSRDSILNEEYSLSKAG